MRLWLNGAVLDPVTARIDPSDRGFTLGDGVFETIHARDGVAPHLARHFARLAAGAARLGIPLPWPQDAVTAAIATIAPQGDTALRLTLTRGPGPRGLAPPAECHPTMLLTAGLLPPLGPVRAIVAQGTRRNERSPLAGIKSLNYLDNILARSEAAEAGADDAILLNTRDVVAEASAANLFARLGGEWLTPRLADGALPGIARARLLEGGFAREAILPLPALRRAEAVFLSSSLGLRPVVSLDGAALARLELPLLPDLPRPR